jgi:hypothetical protein
MTATAARSSPRTSSFCDHQEGGASVPPFAALLMVRTRVRSAGRLVAGGIYPGTTMTTAAAQVPGYHVQFEGDRPGEALIAQPGRRHDDYTPAAAALDLRIEAMTNEIGNRIEAFGSHASPRTYKELSRQGLPKGRLAPASLWPASRSIPPGCRQHTGLAHVLGLRSASPSPCRVSARPGDDRRRGEFCSGLVLLFVPLGLLLCPV